MLLVIGGNESTLLSGGVPEGNVTKDEGGCHQFQWRFWITCLTVHKRANPRRLPSRVFDDDQFCWYVPVGQQGQGAHSCPFLGFAFWGSNFRALKRSNLVVRTRPSPWGLVPTRRMNQSSRKFQRAVHHGSRRWWAGVGGMRPARTGGQQRQRRFVSRGHWAAI